MISDLLCALRASVETSPPDGWFEGDLLWFHAALTPATILARGAHIALPDLKSADDSAREAYYEALGTFMCQLSGDEALQFQWRVDSDYHSELETYREQTQAAGAAGWCAAAREERYRRYRDRQATGKLRRERLELYLARRCSTVPKGGFRTAGQIDRYVEQTAKTFGDRLQQLGGRLPGATVAPSGDNEHFASWRAFCQPGLRLVGDRRLSGRDPRGTILENCWPGGGITTKDTEGNVFFRMDGCYHTLLVLRRWPMETHMGIIWALTTALAGNYCYTLSCYPLTAAVEVEKTEAEMRRLKGSRKHEDKESLDDVLARKKAKISALQGGFARPFSALAVIRAWDASIPGLMAQVQALKEAIGSMGGAQCHQVDDEVQAKCLFYETLPGWTGGRYRDWDLFALAGPDPSVCFLQDMVPLSSSYIGHLEEGEAIYDGEEGNLVGIRTFAENTPQHAVMIGTTRVGKSSQVIDYLSQTDCFFAFRGIVEEGLSYGTLVQLLGGESIVLHPDGDLTLNYLDTLGSPLTRMHTGSAAGLLMVMAGKSSDPEVNAQRKAMLAEYLEQLYADTWNDYRLCHPEREAEAARWAILLDRARRDAEGSYQALSWLELFADLKERAQREPESWMKSFCAIGDAEAIAFARRPESAPLVRDLGLAFLDSAQFPTHTALVEALRYNRMSHHARELVDRLASQLAPWQRQGPHGRLFDGATTRRLENRLVHFELGLLPSANVEMKEAAVFLLANRIRQRIVTLPRALRKQFIFEEPSRYLKVGGMEEMFAEFYAQMGKFGCHIMPVTQQYGQLARSALRPVIFGNSKQFFLFKQNDRQDLDDIGDAVGLPPAARSAIRTFTAPEYQTGETKYSQMAVYSIEGEGSACGVVRNTVTPEMLYVSDSSGERHDSRTKALAAYDDLLEGVSVEARRDQERRNLKRKTNPNTK
ncbi:MAG: hypothetical protein WC378_15775 [Opitutaceae bacterium]|jgi:hypothetical protein